MDTITLNKPHDHTLATRAGWPMGDDWNAMFFCEHPRSRCLAPASPLVTPRPIIDRRTTFALPMRTE